MLHSVCGQKALQHHSNMDARPRTANWIAASALCDNWKENSS